MSEPLPPEPPNLRFLRVLVTILTVVMIGGVITVVTLLVMALSGDRQPVFVHPEMFDLAPGQEVVGYSLWQNRAILVTADGQVLVFDAAGGPLLESFPLP